MLQGAEGLGHLLDLNWVALVICDPVGPFPTPLPEGQLSRLYAGICSENVKCFKSDLRLP